MRKIIFSLFLFLLCISLSSTASAFEDTAERYTPPSTPSTVWYAPSGGLGLSSIGSQPSNTVLAVSKWSSSLYYAIYSKETVNENYVSFTLYPGDRGWFSVKLQNNVTGATVVEYSKIVMSNINIKSTGSKIEIVKSGSYYNFYVDGVQKYSKVWSGDTTKNILVFGVDASEGGAYYIDDVTDSSCIGTQKVWTESINDISFTWSEQLKRSYPDVDHKITLYSITNPNNAGKITEWTIPDNNTVGGAEWGYIKFNRYNTIGLNHGLYLLEMTRDGAIIADTYFYYDSLSNPIGYPESLFLGSADVSINIRDSANNGGSISPGGSVYLYANNGTAGNYSFTYNILNTPYNYKASIKKIYSSETINGTTITFLGLTNPYQIKLDNTKIGAIDNESFTYTITDWENYTEHIFSFSPDLTKPGLYGYVKNLDTKEGVNGAIVTISNTSYSVNLATDETGFYYVSLPANNTYTISSMRSGYTASSDFTVSTVSEETTRKDIYLTPINSGSGIYYASHDVTFTVMEYWYSSAGLPGVSYAVYDDENESVKNGTTGSKGTFTVKDMDAGKNYTFILTHNGTTYTEYLEPGLTEYNLVLNKEGIVHTYYNSWLNITYAESPNNVTVFYSSSKPISEASFVVSASNNGATVQDSTKNTTSGTFVFNVTEGDYILQFDIKASDGSKASQAWSVSSPPEVSLFPASYPAWLKNTLFVAIIIIFLLAFGKSKNDIACGSVAVLTSLGYYFEWLTCGFNFVVLIWIIAVGAIYLHYKRTGAVG